MSQMINNRKPITFRRNNEFDDRGDSGIWVGNNYRERNFRSECGNYAVPVRESKRDLGIRSVDEYDI